MSPRGGSSSSGSDDGSDSSSSSSSSSTSSGSSSTSSSSGSSSSGSSYYYGSDYDQGNVWLSKTRLPGYGVQHGYIVAIIVFAGLFMVALVAIGIWAVTVNSRNRTRGAVKARKGGIRWALAMLFALFCQTYNFIDLILNESEVVVENVYFIIETILLSSAYIADVLLLSAIFGLLHYCFLQPEGPDNAKRGLKGAIYWAHLALCGVLGALYIAILGLGINDIVSSYGPYISYTGIPITSKVQVAFHALYFVAAVEVVAAIGYLTATARKRDLTTKVGISMMGLIGAPLLIRRVFLLAFSAAFSLSLDKYETIGEATAEFIIEGITLVLTFAGVVLAFKQLGELSWKPWDGNHQQAQIPVAGYGNPQAQSPPQMGHQYEPNQYQSPHQNGPISPYNIGQASPYNNNNNTTAHPSHPVTMGHNY